MRRRLLVAGAVCATVMAHSMPASATHGGIHPSFREQGYWFHCVGEEFNKVQNLDYPAPFDTNAPTASVTGGAGCGLVDPGFLANTQPSGGPGDASFAGSVIGNIKNMTVELWLLGHSTYSAIDPAAVSVWLVVDGEHYIAKRTKLEGIPWQASATGASRKIEFTITDLGWTQDVVDEQGNIIDVLHGGLAGEDGDGTTAHEVQLTVGMWYADESGAWVWDATEVPSGITVNDTTPATTTISAGQVPPGT